MYTLAVTLFPFILYTVTHSLPPYAFFYSHSSLMLYYISSVCLYVSVHLCVCARVCVCIYWMLFLNVYELVCEHVSSWLFMTPPEFESQPLVLFLFVW